MYGIGTLLALIGVLLRFQLPESPRWLISRGRVDEADKVVTDMEERARKRMPDLPAPTEIPVQAGATRIPYTEIFSNPLYRQRTILLVIVWFLGYVTVYAIAQGLTVILAGILPLPPIQPKAAAGEAGLIAAFGTLGFILSAVFAYICQVPKPRQRGGLAPT